MINFNKDVPVPPDFFAFNMIFTTFSMVVNFDDDGSMILISMEEIPEFVFDFFWGSTLDI